MSSVRKAGVLVKTETVNGKNEVKKMDVRSQGIVT
jgi:hypothetical protein